MESEQWHLWSKAMYARLLALIVFSFCMQACASKSKIDANEALSCEAGALCELQGIIDVESLWQASLQGSDGCIALALPRSFYENNSAINGRKVLVRGTGYSQPSTEAGEYSYHYEVDGIRVNTNLCKETALEVESIESDNKVIWRAP